MTLGLPESCSPVGVIRIPTQPTDYTNYAGLVTEGSGDGDRASESSRAQRNPLACTTVQVFQPQLQQVYVVALR